MTQNSSLTGKFMKSVLLRTIAAAVLAAAIKTVQFMLFYNQENGMIDGLMQDQPMSFVLGIAVIAILIYISAEYILLAVKVRRAVGYVPFSPKPSMGFGMVIAAVFFGLQALMDSITSFPDLASETQGRIPRLAGPLVMILFALAILSALVYLVQGYGIIKGNKKTAFYANLVPVLWFILVLMNIMMTYPNVVSMQDNAAKVFGVAMALLFLYYMTKWASRFEDGKVSLLNLWIRLAFPSLVLVVTLPNALVYFLGVRDELYNVPYFAIIGLAVYGLVSLFEYGKQATGNDQLTIDN